MKVLAAIVVLTGLVWFLRPGPAMEHVTATLPDARGLVNGADVSVGGVRVGHVEKVWLDGAQPRVRFAVRKSVDLRSDARVAMRLGSQSGEFNRYLALSPGSASQAWAGGVLRGRSPVEVDEALAALDPHTRAELRGALDGLRGALDGTGAADARTLKSTPAALTQLAGVLHDVSSDGAALRTLVASSHDIVGSLAGRPAALRASLASLRALLDTTATRESALQVSLSRLPRGLRSTRGALATTRTAIPDLRAVVRDAAPLSTRLAPVARELRAATAAARPALAQAAPLAKTAPADLHALTPLLRDATPFARQLTPVLEHAGPMLDQTRVRLPDFFSFFSNWADFTSNYDANGHGARVGIVLPPASTQVLDPSGDGAGQLRAPYLRTPGSLEGVPWKDYAKSFVAGGTAAQDVAP